MDDMTSELTERYEELNLIYESDNYTQNIYQGQESLQQMLAACTNYLDVGVTALLLKEKDIALYNFNQERPIPNAHRVLPSLSSDVFRWVKRNKQSIVINHPAEPLRLEVCPEIPYKLLACPVVSGESMIIGMLVIVNLIDKPDFTHSVRNLMELLAIGWRISSRLISIHSPGWTISTALNGV